MHEPNDRDDSGHDLFLTPASRRRRRREQKRRRLAIGGGILLLLLVAGGVWYWLGTGEDAADGVATPERPVPEATDSELANADTSRESSGVRDAPSLDLPELDASDEFLRRVVSGLSQHPRWAAWLVTDDLVHRFVGAVVRVAAGSSPTSQLQMMEPPEEFRVRDDESRTVVHPDSYRRYDRMTEAILSLDTQGTARLYHQLHPLFEEAHQELGFPEGTFDDAVARATDRVLSVEVPDSPPEVVPGETGYEFRDPELENRGPVAKHLLRLGPDNARRVQSKLREIAEAIGIEVGR